MPLTHARDITAGLDIAELEDLSPRQRALMLILLARASERAYRRGLQQGVTLVAKRPEALPQGVDLHDWRYGVSLDGAPEADSKLVSTSVELFLRENRSSQLLALLDTGARPRVGKFVGDAEEDPDSGFVSIHEEAQALVSLGRKLRCLLRADPRPRVYYLHYQAIRAQGMALALMGGLSLMTTVYDHATDIAEDEGERFAMGGAWLGIEGWAD